MEIISHGLTPVTESNSIRSLIQVGGLPARVSAHPAGCNTRLPQRHFVENELSPSLIILLVHPTGHPLTFQR